MLSTLLRFFQAWTVTLILPILLSAGGGINSLHWLNTARIALAKLLIQRSQIDSQGSPHEFPKSRVHLDRGIQSFIVSVTEFLKLKQSIKDLLRQPLRSLEILRNLREGEIVNSVIHSHRRGESSPWQMIALSSVLLQ